MFFFIFDSLFLPLLLLLIILLLLLARSWHRSFINDSEAGFRGRMWKIQIFSGLSLFAAFYSKTVSKDNKCDPFGNFRSLTNPVGRVVTACMGGGGRLRKCGVRLFVSCVVTEIKLPPSLSIVSVSFFPVRLLLQTSGASNEIKLLYLPGRFQFAG